MSRQLSVLNALRFSSVQLYYLYLLARIRTVLPEILLSLHRHVALSLVTVLPLRRYVVNAQKHKDTKFPQAKHTHGFNARLQSSHIQLVLITLIRSSNIMPPKLLIAALLTFYLLATAASQNTAKRSSDSISLTAQLQLADI